MSGNKPKIGVRYVFFDRVEVYEVVPGVSKKHVKTETLEEYEEFKKKMEKIGV